MVASGRTLLSASPRSCSGSSDASRRLKAADYERTYISSGCTRRWLPRLRAMWLVRTPLRLANREGHWHADRGRRLEPAGGAGARRRSASNLPFLLPAYHLQALLAPIR